MTTPDLTSLVILTSLFLLLSPGIVLTLPPVSKTQCTNFGVADCSTPGGGAYSVDCNKCTSAWASGYTWRWAMLLHTIVFGFVGYLLLLAADPVLLTTRTQTFGILVYATLLFFLLSPGNIFSFWPNSKNYCKNVLAISDCDVDGPYCNKCTSFMVSQFTSVSSMFFNALVFVGVLLLTTRYLVR